MANVLSTTSSWGEKGKLVMTNAHRADGYATDVTENIETSEALAEKNPATIIVERVAAKVEMKYADTNEDGVFPITDEKGNDITFTVDGKETTMSVTVNGWTLNAYNQTSYLVKNHDASWATAAPFANWVGTNRTFWAKDANYAAGYGGLVYEAAPTTKQNATYCHENTMETATVSDGQQTNATTMLISATISYKDADGNDVPGATLYEYRGAYYTAATFKTLCMNALSPYAYYKADPVEGGTNHIYEGISESDITWEDTFESINAAKGEVVLEIKSVATKEGFTLVKKADNSAAALTDLNTAIKNDYVAACYSGGKTYYQVPIEHLAAEGTGQYGIVRNHSYVLTLSGIRNLGGADYNPEGEHIYIPGGDETNFYVAAKLQVLAWKVVTQDVEL